MSVSFSNNTQHMSKSAHGHPSSFQAPNANLTADSDVESKLQALACKDGIRVKEFFIDFDKLRKGTCGEAAVSYTFELYNHIVTVPHLSRHSLNQLEPSPN